MKFTIAAAFLAGSAAAFSPAFATHSSNALKMSAVETEVYTFAKSEEIFAEAQTVSFCAASPTLCMSSQLHVMGAHWELSVQCMNVSIRSW